MWIPLTHFHFSLRCCNCFSLNIVFKPETSCHAVSISIIIRTPALIRSWWHQNLKRQATRDDIDVVVDNNNNNRERKECEQDRCLVYLFNPWSKLKMYKIECQQVKRFVSLCNSVCRQKKKKKKCKRYENAVTLSSYCIRYLCTCAFVHSIWKFGENRRRKFVQCFNKNSDDAYKEST